MDAGAAIFLIIWTVLAVGGCEYKDPNDPGNLQFDWIEVQLRLFRSRGVKVRACDRIVWRTASLL